MVVFVVILAFGLDLPFLVSVERGSDGQAMHVHLLAKLTEILLQSMIDLVCIYDVGLQFLHLSLELLKLLVNCLYISCMTVLHL